MRTGLSSSLLGLLWTTLGLGLLLNIFASYIFVAEIGKDIFLFGEFPVGALHVSLVKKALFVVMNTAVVGAAAVLFLQGRRIASVMIGLLAVINVAIMLSSAVGTLR